MYGKREVIEVHPFFAIQGDHLHVMATTLEELPPLTHRFDWPATTRIETWDYMEKSQ